MATGQMTYYKDITGRQGVFPYIAQPEAGGPPPGYVAVSRDEYKQFLTDFFNRGYLNNPGDQNMAMARQLYGPILEQLNSGTGPYGDTSYIDQTTVNQGPYNQVPFTGSPSDFANPNQAPTNPPQMPPQTQTLGDMSGGVSFPTQNLQPGMTGDAVKQLQDYLVSQGFMTQAQVNTGYGTYGPQTTAAVAKLQKALGVDNSSGPGYWGPKTISALQSNQGSTQNTKNNQQTGSNNANSTISTTSSTTSTGNSLQDQINSLPEPLKSIMNGVGTFLDRLSQNGTVINPNATITPEQAAAFMTTVSNNIQAFVPYATNEIAPYYQSQLNQAKQSFLTGITYDAQQLAQNEQDLEKTYNQQLKDIGTSSADMGFAQSGIRQKQEGDLAYNTNRQIQNNRQALGFKTTQVAQQFASQYGGSNVPNVNISTAPTAGSGDKLAFGTGTQPLYNISDSIYQGLQGTQQYQQEADIQSRAGALANAFQQNQATQTQRSLLI